MVSADKLPRQAQDKFIKVGSEKEPIFSFTIPMGAERIVDTIASSAYS